MYRHPLAVLALAVAAMLPGAAAAFDDYTGRWGGTWSAYGQLSPSAIGVDDGQQTETVGVDNSQSISRIGLILRRPFGRGQFRFRFETSLGLRESKNVSQVFTGPAFDWNRSDIRFFDTIWDFGSRGTVSVGHGSMATDNVAKADLSGTDLANSVSVPDMAGNFLFRTSSGVLSPVAVKSAYETFDGIRRARLRYDWPVPTVQGLVLSTSVGAEILKKNNNENNLDIAFSYRSKFDAVSVQAAAGASLTWVSGQRTRKDLVASVSVLHRASGLSLTAAAGTGNPGGHLAYVKLGYQAHILDAGPTAFSVDAYRGWDLASQGSLSEAWGVAVVQHLRRPGLQVFVGLRRYKFADLSALSYLPLNAVQVGTRWQF